MIDAVLSYHLNPFTCGVAKFNHALAKRLGVPCLPLGSASKYPLLSIKPQEMPSGIPFFDTDKLSPHYDPWDLFLHGPSDARYLQYPKRIYAASGDIAEAVRPYRADVIEVFCPSTLDGTAHRGTLNVLLFGMAHKIHVHTVYIERLRDVLERAHNDYTVSVSTSVHEQQPWDETFTKTIANLRKVFGAHLRVLGYLADDALVRELQDCDAAALFFDPAARANNTTIWAALEAGCPVITNLDRDSPPDLIHNQTVFDLSRMTHWPFAPLRHDVARGGQRAAQGRSWDKLIEALRA